MFFSQRLTMLIGMLLLGLYGEAWTMEIEAKPHTDEISFRLKFSNEHNSNNILEQEEQLFTDMHMKYAGNLSQETLGNKEATFQETLRSSFSKTRTSFENKAMYLVVAQNQTNNLLGSIFFFLSEINGKPVIRIRHFNARNFDDHQNLALLFKGMLTHIQTTFPYINSMICVSHKEIIAYDAGLKSLGFKCIDFVPEECTAEHQQTYEYNFEPNLASQLNPVKTR
ncbi:hypothetical protein JST56_00385 [Candidatus Dependentiae bacterium]|nr:hypothetical protein [Candidatus Dependentiae bacterium]